MKMFSLFDYTGEMARPWLEGGYECHIFDIQHPKKAKTRKDGMITHNWDLRNPDIELFRMIGGGKVAFLSCFPPCTHLSISGARWFKGKGLRALEESIGYFATSVEVAEELECPYMIENPMSTVSTYWRAPDFTFHPAHYSGYVDGEENYTKDTWIWCGNGFVMPPRSMSNDLFHEVDRTYIHYQPPGKDRQNIRSATPKGFAQAVYQSMHPQKAPL